MKLPNFGFEFFAPLFHAEGEGVALLEICSANALFLLETCLRCTGGSDAGVPLCAEAAADRFEFRTPLVFGESMTCCAARLGLAGAEMLLFPVSSA
jgi:hypothetical protein